MGLIRQNYKDKAPNTSNFVSLCKRFYDGLIFTGYTGLYDSKGRPREMVQEAGYSARVN